MLLDATMTICHYRDFYAVDVSDVRSQVNIPSCKRKGPRGGVVSPFPVKLFSMLKATGEEGLDHVVSWQVHGRCFMIHKSEQFVSDVLPRYVVRKSRRVDGYGESTAESYVSIALLLFHFY